MRPVGLLTRARIAAVMVAATGASAADLHVATTGDDASDGLSWATALATPGAAVAVAAATPEADTVHVSEGVHDISTPLVVPANTALLGGYPAGGGTRAPRVHWTVLDGGPLNRIVWRVWYTGSVIFRDHADGTTLDGFTVRHCTPGIRVQDSGPLIHDCIVELCGSNGDDDARNGIAIGYSAPGPILHIDGCTIRGNFATTSFANEGAPLAGLSLSSTVDVGTFMTRTLFEGNGLAPDWAPSGGPPGGAELTIEINAPRARMEDVVITNCWGLVQAWGTLDLFNVLSETLFMLHDYGTTTASPPSRWQFTTATAGAGVYSTGAAVQDSILWPARPHATRSDRITVSNVIIAGGWPVGTDILDADPLFTRGSWHDEYLSEIACGQPSTSPGIDAGSDTALALGVDTGSTRTDSAADAGQADLGFHVRPGPLDAFPLQPSTTPGVPVRRGVAADALGPYAFIPSLPFTDAPGTLHEPALARVYYEVPGSTEVLLVSKDLATDSVRLAWR